MPLGSKLPHIQLPVRASNCIGIHILFTIGVAGKVLVGPVQHCQHVLQCQNCVGGLST